MMRFGSARFLKQRRLTMVGEFRKTERLGILRPFAVFLSW